MEFPHIEATNLGDFFPEIAALSGDCRFTGCAHINEPDCAVRGAIDDERYEHYVQLYEELKSNRRY